MSDLFFVNGNSGSAERSLRVSSRAMESVMSHKASSRDPGGQQPEALASLKAAARSGSKKSKDQGLRASPSTAPQPGSLEAEEGKAADILAKGAAKDTGST